jgi:TonB family protein
LDEQLEFIVEEEERPAGVSWSVIASIVAHAALILWVIHSYHPVQPGDAAPPIAKYVELIRQNPRDFTEAPGPKIDKAPITAPLSDANRKASTPQPTGDTPTRRPGDGSRVFMPPQQSGDAGRQSPPPQAAQTAQQPSSPMVPPSQPAQHADTSALTFRQPTQQQQAAAAASGQVDWHNAIREVGKVASLGSGHQGLDLGQLGGEKGTAEAGPLSFETQWYDWGEYAESMVSKIRVHWYEEMPMPLLQSGMKGVVTIRFTIHRDGRITDVTILNSSSVTPYDFAAMKAIELASPLKPLPPDFPKDTERVTAMFYYNQEPPNR